MRSTASHRLLEDALGRPAQVAPAPGRPRGAAEPRSPRPSPAWRRRWRPRPRPVVPGERHFRGGAARTWRRPSGPTGRWERGRGSGAGEAERARGTRPAWGAVGPAARVLSGAAPGVTCAAVLPPQVEEAGHVFLLMKKDYRISRNVRLAWVLSRLHQVIRAVPEPELVSWCSGLDGVTAPVLHHSVAPAPCTAFEPHSFLWFFFWRNLVFSHVPFACSGR